MTPRILTIIFIFFNIFSGHAQDNLQSYLDSAVANSPLVKDFKNQSEAFILEAERLKAFYTKPQVTLTGAYLFAPLISNESSSRGFKYNPDDPNNYSDNYYGYDLAASNGGLYQGLLNFTQPVFNGSRAKVATEQAKLQASSFENTARLTAHDVEKFVTDQYILCLQDLRQIEYFTRLTAIIKEQLSILDKLVGAGILKQSDKLLIQIEYKNQLAALSTFKTTYRRDLMQLRVLSGISDTSFVELKNTDLMISPDVEQNSKYLIKYRIDSLNLLATRELFNLKYKPQVNLIANTGLNAVNYRTIPQRFGMSAGVNFTWYLYDGGQRKINNAKADVLINSTQAYKDITIKQNRVRKEQVLQELEQVEQRLILLKSQLDEYNELLDYYKQELVSGQISVINYINVQKNSVFVNRDYLVLQAQRQLLINTYNYWNW